MKVFVALWCRDTEHRLDVDQDTRFAGLEEAVNKAQEQSEAARSGSTDFTWDIKSIFVAPEYLFTRQRKIDDDDQDRAIGVEEAQSIGKKLKTLSKGKPDMLMVPGTVIYKYAPGLHKDGEQGAKQLLTKLDTDLAKKPAKVRGLAPPNEDTAPTIQAKIGMLDGTGKIDHFVRNRMFVFLNGKVVAQYSKMADKSEATGKVPGVYIPGRESGLVDPLHGRSFGFEICYDHEIGVLKAMSSTTVDFHVIASAFVTNNTSSMMAKPGGFVLHASSSAEHSTIYFKPNDAWKRNQVDVNLKRLSWAKADEAGADFVQILPSVDVGGDPLKCFVLTMS